MDIVMLIPRLARRDPDLLVGIVVGVVAAGSLYAGLSYGLSRLF